MTDAQKSKAEEFRNQLDWFMGDDNPATPNPDRDLFEVELNAEAVARGFQNWLDAWHHYSPRETEGDALLRIAYVPGPDGR